MGPRASSSGGSRLAVLPRCCPAGALTRRACSNACEAHQHRSMRFTHWWRHRPPVVAVSMLRRSYAWRPKGASLRPSARSDGNGVADPSPGPNAGTYRQRDRAANEGRCLSSRGRARSTGLHFAQEVCAGVRLGIRRLSTVRGIQVGGTAIRECNIERHGAEHGREGNFVPHFRVSSFAELSSVRSAEFQDLVVDPGNLGDAIRPASMATRDRWKVDLCEVDERMLGHKWAASRGIKARILSKNSGSCLPIDVTPPHSQHPAMSRASLPLPRRSSSRPTCSCKTINAPGSERTATCQRRPRGGGTGRDRPAANPHLHLLAAQLSLPTPGQLSLFAPMVVSR